MASSFKIKVDYIKYQLDFKFDAGTSRGVLKTKDTFFIKVTSANFPGLSGYGEAGPLPKLSVDDVPDFEDKLRAVCRHIQTFQVPESEDGILDFVCQAVPAELPSVRFALEVALLDLIYGGKRKIFHNSFYEGLVEMAINGLIWMGDRDFMLEQIDQKLEEGYSCIKMKIGSIDFDQECEILSFIRDRYSIGEISLRVDANGAFSKGEALSKLHRLSAFGLHSIEQPIRQGDWDTMKYLCRTSPVPIALDEELIGIDTPEEKAELLDCIQPQFIILKPTLVGGILSTREWIAMAETRNIGWWMTSALESNIGLNAIAQLTAGYDPLIPQGLGTGQIYRNNIGSPLTVKKGMIHYDKGKFWDNIDKLFGK